MPYPGKEKEEVPGLETELSLVFSAAKTKVASSAMDVDHLEFIKNSTFGPGLSKVLSGVNRGWIGFPRLIVPMTSTCGKKPPLLVLE